MKSQNNSAQNPATDATQDDSSNLSHEAKQYIQLLVARYRAVKESFDIFTAFNSPSTKSAACLEDAEYLLDTAKRLYAAISSTTRPPRRVSIDELVKQQNQQATPDDLTVDFKHRLSVVGGNDSRALVDTIDLMADRAKSVLMLLYTQFDGSCESPISNTLICSVIDTVFHEIGDIEATVEAYHEVELAKKVQADANDAAYQLDERRKQNQQT